MDENFSEFVRNWQENFKITWDQIPENQRGDLERMLRRLPGDLKGWRILIDEAVDQIRTAVGGKHKVAIIGPVNSGKSTLYNQLIRPGEGRADVSAVPGTTRRTAAADAGIFTLIDTPGADAVGAVGEQEKARAMEAAREADFIVLLLDASHGVRPSQQQLYIEVQLLEKPMVVVLNKIDLVKKEKRAIVEQAAKALGLEKNQILLVSAKKRTGLETLLLSIAKSEPGLVAALGAAMPEYRRRLSDDVIRKAASTAAAVGATPLPVIDFIPLIVIQSAMVISIARIYNFEITFQRAKELIATFGLGMLGRTLFYQLSKFGGPPGWLVAAAIAAGTSMAMGYAARVWFEKGERVSKEMLASISRSISMNILERLKNIGKRKPARKKLEESVAEVLEGFSTQEGIEKPQGHS